MNKKTKNIIAIIASILLIAVICAFRINNMSATTRAVVVKVNEKSLLAMGIENVTGLFSVGFTDEGNIGFKQGQEILIYFDGMVMESYPAKLGKAQKIKIVKEKSDIKIPDETLRYCYSSLKNVKAIVSEFTSSGITLIIEDTNELPYSYSNNYTIYKKVKNKDYTGIGYQIEENTGNSTAGYTRNRS